MASGHQGVDGTPLHLYAIDTTDPHSELIDRKLQHPDEVAQISALMASLARLREAEQAISAASQRYMKLGTNEMKALLFLIISANTGSLATPSAIANHLKISTASTTKLLDRLEAGGHITRAPHPTDRRALTITVTPATHRSAMETVGRQHAKRYTAAARLTHEERNIVIRFLNEMSEDLAVIDGDWAGEHPKH